MKWVTYLAVLGFFGAVIFGGMSLDQGVEPREAVLLGLGFLLVFAAGILFNIPEVLFMRFLSKRSFTSVQPPESIAREVVPHHGVQSSVESQPSNQPLHPDAQTRAGERRR